MHYVFFSFWLTSVSVFIHFNWLQFIPFYGWVIFHYINIHVPQLPSPFICQWTSNLLPCPDYCKQCCNEHWGTCMFLNYGFLRVHLFALSDCSWGSQGKNTKMACHSLLQWTMFCQNSTMTEFPEESEKAGLKHNIQKTKIMASSPITSWQTDGETVETVTDYFWGLQNHCW